MNNIDKQYKELCEHILRSGRSKHDRTGTGTKSIFGWQIRHEMKDGFPLLTTKKVAWKQIVSELLWFLQGRTDLRYLLENKNHIWVGDAYKRYSDNWTLENPPFSGPYDKILSKEEFIEQIQKDDKFNKLWGDLGPIYGKQWRHWEYGEYKTFKNGKTYPSGEYMYDIKKEHVDQIQKLITDLTTDPDSRRLMVSAWNVGELDQMILPPCHYGFQVYTRELQIEERSLLYTNLHGPDDGWKDFNNSHDFYNDCFIPSRAVSLKWDQRSVDVGLGLPFNIASYGLLLCILGKLCNMVPESLIGSLGDCHIYNDHVDGIKKQLARTPYLPPTLTIKTEKWKTIISDTDSMINSFQIDDFQILNYKSHLKIEFPLSN